MHRGSQNCTIVETFPRDGLQTMVYEKRWRVPTTEEKVRIIQALTECGFREIEIAGFAHPRVIPPLADAEDVVRRIGRKEGVVYRVLVPNLKGAERALAVNAQKLACLISASETYQALNSNMSIEENARQIEQIVELCRQAGTPVEVGIGGSFICPYEGVIPDEKVLRLIERFVRTGIEMIAIADSIGMANPWMVTKRVRKFLNEWPDLQLSLHLHDLSGMGLVNVFAAWQAGVEIFETSICGLGWGIASPGSIAEPGNLATEDVVNMFEGLGVNTGLRLRDVLAVAKFVEEILGRPGKGRITRVGTLDDLLRLGKDHLARSPSAPGDSSVGTSDWMDAHK